MNVDACMKFLQGVFHKKLTKENYYLVLKTSEITPDRSRSLLKKLGATWLPYKNAQYRDCFDKSMLTYLVHEFVYIGSSNSPRVHYDCCHTAYKNAKSLTKELEFGYFFFIKPKHIKQLEVKVEPAPEVQTAP